MPPASLSNTNIDEMLRVLLVRGVPGAVHQVRVVLQGDRGGKLCTTITLGDLVSY